MTTAPLATPDSGSKADAASRSTEPRGEQGSRNRALSLLLLALAFLAPSLSAWWGRDAYPFVDETQLVATSLSLELRSPTPPEANWPPHSYHLLRAEWFLGRSFCLLPALDSFLATLKNDWYRRPTTLLYSARGLAWFLTLITVWLSYGLARCLLPRIGAASAALLFATSPLCLQYSRYMVTEMPHALWCTAALLCAMRLLNKKRASVAFAAGATTALTVASKYLGGLAGLAVAWTYFVPGSRRAEARWGGVVRMLTGALAIAAGFAVGLLFGMPDLIANHDAYLAWLQKHFAATDWVWFGFEDAPPPHAFHARYTLPHIAGSFFALAAAILGFAILLWQKPRHAIGLLLFAAAYFAIAGGNAIRYTRYFLVLAPIFALAIATLGHTIATRSNHVLAKVLATALVLGCALPSFWFGIAQARAAGAGDTRFDAATRLEGQVNHGAGIVTLRARRGAGEFAFLHNPEYPRLDLSVLEWNLASTLQPDQLILWDEFLARFAAARGDAAIAELLPRLQALGVQRAPGEVGGWIFPSPEALYDALLVLGLDRYLWSGFVEGVFDDLEPTTYPAVRRFLALIEQNEMLWKIEPGGELRHDLRRVELVTQGSAHRGVDIGGPELRLYQLRPRQ